MPRLPKLAAALGVFAALSSPASAQVAFQPVVTAFPNGVTLSATPAVSVDRRYVRMTLNPQFSAIEGFDAFSVPAAVSGGGGGAGGFRNVGAPLAGMDGMFGPESAAYALSPSESPGASGVLSGAGFAAEGRPRLTPGPGQTAPPKAARRPSRGGKARRPRTALRS